MLVNLYTLAKRENSTQQPTGSGTQFSCYLKNPTSVIDPVIVIDHADQNAPQMHYFNYAYIPDFGRYYFITDIRSIGHVWEYSMSTDILATYKGTITASTLYLLRCSSQYDGSILDTMYPAKVSKTVVTQSMATPWIHDSSENITLSDGCFILGVAAMPGSSGYSALGSIKYVALTWANLNTLINYLMDANTLTNENVTISGVSSEAVKSIIDPLSFIKSCQWSPIEYTSIVTTELSNLEIWSWTATGVSYKPMRNNPPYYVWSISFASFAKHPLAASRGSYLNSAPFSKYIARIPPFGLIELDTTLMADVTTIVGLLTYDIITGQGILEIHYGDQPLGPAAVRVTSQIGVPIQLTQVYNDYISAAGGVAGGILGAVGSLLTGNVGGAIMSGMSAVGSAVDAMRPVQSSLGGNGGFSDLYGQARLYAIFYDIADEDLAHHGRPLCQNVVMQNVTSGSYCLAMDGDIQISGTAGEQAALKEFLEGGFYYE